MSEYSLACVIMKVTEVPVVVCQVEHVWQNPYPIVFGKVCELRQAKTL